MAFSKNKLHIIFSSIFLRLNFNFIVDISRKEEHTWKNFQERSYEYIHNVIWKHYLPKGTLSLNFWIALCRKIFKRYKFMSIREIHLHEYL